MVAQGFGVLRFGGGRREGREEGEDGGGRGGRGWEEGRVRGQQRLQQYGDEERAHSYGKETTMCVRR